MGSKSGSDINNVNKHKQDDGGDGALHSDRISNLPDCVISHILSFLDIKSAVTTSSLSKRWESHWTSIDVVEFSDTTDRGSLQQYPFGNVGERVLFKLTSNKIRSFSLDYSRFCDVARISAWILYALGVKNAYRVNLSVMSYWLIPHQLPKCILAWNKLVFLVLESRFDVRIPNSTVSFPCLKSLSLVVVYPDDGKLLHKLLPMWPVLEDFYLHGLLCARKLVIPITNRSFKNLRLELSADYDLHEHKVTIDTPNLQMLNIDDNLCAQYTYKDIGSEYNVYLTISGGITESIEGGYISLLAQLIIAVAKIKYLFLSHTTVAVLTEYKALDKLGWPTFPSLTKVVVSTNVQFGLTLLPGILKSAPYLKCLHLTKDMDVDDDYNDEDFNWILPQGVPCLEANLLVVHYQFFKGLIHEMEVLEYLLKNAQALELVSVGVLPEYLNNERVKKLVTLPRCSSVCKVEVYDTFSLIPLFWFFIFIFLPKSLQLGINILASLFVSNAKC